MTDEPLQPRLEFFPLRPTGLALTELCVTRPSPTSSTLLGREVTVSVDLTAQRADPAHALLLTQVLISLAGEDAHDTLAYATASVLIPLPDEVKAGEAFSTGYLVKTGLQHGLGYLRVRLYEALSAVGIPYLIPLVNADAYVMPQVDRFIRELALPAPAGDEAAPIAKLITDEVFE